MLELYIGVLLLHTSSALIMLVNLFRVPECLDPKPWCLWGEPSLERLCGLDHWANTSIGGTLGTRPILSEPTLTMPSLMTSTSISSPDGYRKECGGAKNPLWRRTSTLKNSQSPTGESRLFGLQTRTKTPVSPLSSLSGIENDAHV